MKMGVLESIETYNLKFNLKEPLSGWIRKPQGLQATWLPNAPCTLSNRRRKWKFAHRWVESTPKMSTLRRLLINFRFMILHRKSFPCLYFSFRFYVFSFMWMEKRRKKYIMGMPFTFAPINDKTSSKMLRRHNRGQHIKDWKEKWDDERSHNFHNHRHFSLLTRPHKSGEKWKLTKVKCSKIIFFIFNFPRGLVLSF